MFVDTVFDPVLDIERVVGVSCVVRANWYDSCGQQVVVPVKRVIRAVTDYPDRLVDGKRVTRDGG